MMGFKVCDKCGKYTEKNTTYCDCASKEVKKLRREIKKLTEALKWYADESINQHNYHATMNTDLTAKARELLEKHK